MNKSGKRYGFTLVELMVAALLAGIALIIALPLILVGRNTDTRTERKEAIALAGDAIYEYVADEMKFAGRLYLGNLTDKKPTGENWKSITVSEKDSAAGENYARLLYGSVAELSEGEGAVDSGNPLYDEAYQQKTDLVIEAEAAGKDQLRLTVKLMDGEQALYEKTAVLSLLNLTLNAASQIEGYVGGAMTTANVPETAAEKSGGEGGPAGHLVLWYQSTKETVNPFESGTLEGENQGEFPLTPGDPVVSLANPQYVKVGETLNVQFKAQARDGKKIVQYEWTLDDNLSGDGSSYAEKQTGAEQGKCVLKGVKATEDGKPVRLTLEVTYDDNGTDSDTCDVIVYEGYRPGSQPVAGFVIVPDGLEEEYAKHPEYPAWIKTGELKRFWLEAVDGNGEIVPYSPDNWYCSYDSNMVYKAFNFVWNWTPVLLKADGEPKLDGIVKGKNTETEASGIGRNYVEMQSLGMETDDSKIHMNSQSISFGGENRTAYRPNGKAEIHVSRVINIYDAKADWKYLTDADGTQLKDIKDADIPEVQVLSTSEYIDLNINLETIIRLGKGVNRKNEPEISSQSVKWFLEGRPVFSGDDICRFGIKENEIGKAQLSVGTNRISVEFLDTAGFSYQREIHVKVPSEVAYVELAQDEYVLANLNQEIDGVSSLPLEYVLYDAEGEPVYDNMENETVKNAYTVEWTTGAEPCPFKLIADSTSNMEKVVSKTIGNGTIFLKVKERASGREIVGEDGQPATAVVVVKPMEISLALRYNSGQGGSSFVTVESGKMIPVFSNTAGLITGFNASLKLPEEISNRLTESQKNNLEKEGWDKISWKMTGPSLYSAYQEWNTNVYNTGYNYGTGTVKFEASANLDAAVNGLISVAVNEAPAAAVSVENVYENDFNELVIGAGADRANDQYNSVTLRANVEGQGGKDCDKSVIWTVRSGKELVDTSGGVWNIEVDSEEQKYYPKIRLKSGLTEDDAGKKIVVRATSASSGKHADYTITILPQFKITYPYSEKFTLVHMSDGESDSKNSVPGSRTIEANRDADWEIKKAQEYLVFDGNTEKTSKVTIVTQKIVNDVVTYNVEAKDSLTGQTDSRTVIVEFEKIEEQKEHNDGWALHFNPNGVFYMDIGEKKEFEASSSSTIVSMGRELTQEGDISSVNSRYSYSLNIFGLSYKGTLYVEASEPGTVTFYSRSLIFGIRSAEYVKIIVRGLEFDKTSYTTDISGKTYNMKSVLNSGDIDLDSCIWESSNRNIATINDSGTVSLLKPGKTTITVSGRANSNGKAFTSQCELIVTATGWGTVNSISNKWENNVGSSVVLMAGSGQYGNAEMSPTISGSSLYPVYYTVESESEGKAANGILRTEGRTAIAQGEGKVKITAGAADKVSSPLYAEIYELKSISVKLKKIGDSEAGEDDSGKNILNFITDGPKSLTLKSDLIWGSYSAENIQRIPAEFKKYIWEIDEKSKEYVDLVTNSDGTCTVTAKGMGAAYITCRSVANPDIYETYVVIVSF